MKRTILLSAASLLLVVLFTHCGSEEVTRSVPSEKSAVERRKKDMEAFVQTLTKEERNILLRCWGGEVPGDFPIPKADKEACEQVPTKTIERKWAEFKKNLSE